MKLEIQLIVYMCYLKTLKFPFQNKQTDYTFGPMKLLSIHRSFFVDYQLLIVKIFTVIFNLRIFGRRKCFCGKFIFFNKDQ